MKVLVTGCCGLVGSAVVDRFASAGHAVVGLDNDMRAEFFGPAGSTAGMRDVLEHRHGLNFAFLPMDVRDTKTVSDLFKAQRFDAVVHCAAQPSHDRAAEHPLEDFDINARATVGLLEACRRHCLEAPFVFMSTNKVYSEVSEALTIERESRLDFLEWPTGVDEAFRVDQGPRSVYGAGKLAADIYVQEYAHHYGLRTVCLRAGCITGAGHAAVSLHGFLSYVVRCNLAREHYVVKGYGGKQVRDNLHAADLADLIAMIVERAPEPGSVYNVGGGKANSCSILEAFAAVEAITGIPMDCSHDHEPRRGDHACYYTDLRKVTADYGWRPQRDLSAIYADLVADWGGRRNG